MDYRASHQCCASMAGLRLSQMTRPRRALHHAQVSPSLLPFLPASLPPPPSVLLLLLPLRVLCSWVRDVFTTADAGAGKPSDEQD